LFLIKAKVRNIPFWGWPTVLVCGLVLGISSGTAFYANSVYLLPLQRFFATDRTVIAQAFAMTHVVAAGVLPFIGMLVDRWGPRRTMILGMGGLALTHFLLSRIDSLWQFYILIIVQQSVFTRCADLLTLQSLIGRWFVRLRGRATGVTLAGVGVAGLALPALLAIIIERQGWRSAYLLSAALVAGIVLPAVAILLVDSPAALRQYPDGAMEPPSLKYATGRGATFKQAVRSPALWILIICSVLCYIDHGMVALQLPAMFEGAGLSASAAASFFGFMLGVSVIGRLSIGSLADRFDRSRVLGFSLLGMALGVCMLLWPASPVARILFVFIYGVASGGVFTVFPVTGQALFGLRAFGKIYALVGLATALGTAGGNYLGARMFDWMGDYRGAVIIAIIASTSAGLLALTLKKPTWDEQETPAT